MQTNSKQFLRLPEILGPVWPGSESSLRRAIKRGDFPAPTRLGQRIAAWPVGLVEKWKADKSAA